MSILNSVAAALFVIAGLVILLYAVLACNEERERGERKPEEAKTNGPNCANCCHMEIAVCDDFPVSKCPMCGEIPRPYTSCCENYVPKGGPK